MIITKTPFRMSFFGGGTDMQEYFKTRKGTVISTTFDKYCYVNVRHLPPFFDYTTEAVYSRLEQVKSIEDLNHPLIRNAMQMLYMHELHISYDADLPARSGLGTSSSFAVGMLNAFHALKGQYVDKRRLADEAIYLERTLCQEKGGWQDQIAASFGGLNRIDFYEDTYEVTPVVMPMSRKRELNENLMLFFTGFTRISSEVQKINSSKTAEEQANKNRLLDEMQGIAENAYQALVTESRSLDEIGYLLDESWQRKRRTGRMVSTNAIDLLYQRGIQEGALGGKLLGAGGGGFLLFYVPKERQEAVKKAMEELLYIPFSFENAGTQIVYYSEEEYSSSLRREK